MLRRESELGPGRRGDRWQRVSGEERAAQQRRNATVTGGERQRRPGALFWLFIVAFERRREQALAQLRADER